VNLDNRTYLYIRFCIFGTKLFVLFCFLESVTGILKGYDQLLNLVMDEVEEILRGMCLVHFSFYQKDWKL
jgi:small nuclear ribonucleoprotein (snRNP)-like protein